MPRSRWSRLFTPRRLFWALAVFVFGWMLLLNALTPYIADDFTFAYRFDNGARLAGVGDLFPSLWFHYFEWTGRVIVKFFAQGFTLLPKAVFNLCNAAMYLLLGWVAYLLAVGRRHKKADALLFLLIQLSLWLVSPAFGQTNLWMCGSCNYLWASVGCLSFLLPWRFYLDQPFANTPRLTAAMTVAGLLAGWLSENTSAGLLVGVVLATGWVWARQKRPQGWMVGGFLGALTGFALLILAPGNTVRSSQEVIDPRPLLTRLAVHFFDALNMLWDNGAALLLVFAVLFVLACHRGLNADRLAWPLILFFSAMGANFAMIGSPVYYARSSHGVFSLLTAACAACAALLLDVPAARCAGRALAAALCVAAAVSMAEAGYDIASYRVMYAQRDALLAEADKSGDVVTYGIECYTPYCAAWDLPDIRENGEDSIALARAKWYGVSGSLTADEVRTYPFPGHTNQAYLDGLADEE